VQVAAWTGVGLSLIAVSGLSELFGTPVSMLIWAVLWLLYLSFVNVGRTFYGFGWESMLLETGFLAIFLGAFQTATPFLMIVLLRWVLFRNMFGAGLIKLRGDDCWRDLTCMYDHYETQPLPNPLSWYADKLPNRFHNLSVVGNHVVELAVPFLYFAPQPLAAIAGLLTIGHMAWLMFTGNYAFLNALTIVLAIPLFSDSVLTTFFPVDLPAVAPVPGWQHAVVLGLALVVAYKSIAPVKNLLSDRQVMNTSFDPLHLVNTYGAFGSVTKTRYQLVIEGTDKEAPEAEDWKAYTFYGQPVKPGQRPRQWAPYHLRLDWQLWFAAMQPRPAFRQQWIPRLVEKLLENDATTLQLLDHAPFPENGPEQIRIKRYVYTYTGWAEQRATGNWWRREPDGIYYGPVSSD
jgi:hypothetical protein